MGGKVWGERKISKLTLQAPNKSQGNAKMEKTSNTAFEALTFLCFLPFV
jgi:hypothetical protein